MVHVAALEQAKYSIHTIWENRVSHTLHARIMYSICPTVCVQQLPTTLRRHPFL